MEVWNGCEHQEICNFARMLVIWENWVISRACRAYRLSSIRSSSVFRKSMLLEYFENVGGWTGEGGHKFLISLFWIFCTLFKDPTCLDLLPWALLGWLIDTIAGDLCFYCYICVSMPGDRNAPWSIWTCYWVQWSLWACQACWACRASWAWWQPGSLFLAEAASAMCPQ